MSPVKKVTQVRLEVNGNYIYRNYDALKKASRLSEQNAEDARRHIFRKKASRLSDGALYLREVFDLCSGSSIGCWKRFCNDASPC